MPTSAALPLVRREPQPELRCCWRDRATPSNCRAGAQRNLSPVLSPLGRLFWILFSRWWPQWRDSLIIVQPRRSCAGAVTVGHRLGDIDPGVAGAVGARGSPVKSAIESHRWPVRTFSGMRHGSMASFSCLVSASLKPRYRATCLHQSPCPWPAMPSKRTSADYPSPHLRIRSSTDSFVPESINLCRGSLESLSRRDAPNLGGSPGSPQHEPHDRPHHSRR